MPEENTGQFPEPDDNAPPRLVLKLHAPFGTLEIQGSPTAIRASIPIVMDIFKEVNESFSMLFGGHQKQTTLPDIVYQDSKQKRNQPTFRSTARDNAIPIMNRSSPRSLTGRIQTLFDEGYFATPQTADEVRKQLEQRGYHYETRRISSELTRSFVRRNLLRRLGSRGAYQFVAR